MDPDAPIGGVRPRPGLPPRQQQDVIDAEMRASRRGVLAEFHRRLRTDPETLVALEFLTLADRHIVRTAIVVAAGCLADACTLHIFDPKTAALRTVRHSGVPLGLRDRLAAFLTARGIGPNTTDPVVLEHIAPTDLGFAAVHAYPLRDERGDPLGVLSLQYRTPGPHPRQDRLAAFAAEAMAGVPAAPTLPRRTLTADPTPPGVTVTRTPDGVAVHVGGALDAVTAPGYRQLLRRTVAALAPHQSLIIDLRELEFLAAAGARVLVDAARRCEDGAVSCYLLAGRGHFARTVLDRLDPRPPLSFVEDEGRLPTAARR
ncbi:STAS domain-containing protein [Dactylosporangium sp. CS-047395]|uniref:STAS domain-containing protein n=1 Tax=Dactylosporangium sp. CS-047395 TaxID=3239936 RepID=UPI003D908C72